MPGPPQQNGGAVINEGLATLSEGVRTMFGQMVGLFSASQGDNPGLQSGIAIERLQDRGDTGIMKYREAQEVAIGRTGRLLVDAIPRVYDGPRRVQLTGRDGSIQTVDVNQDAYDAEEEKFETKNELTRSKFSVTCTAGPSFANQQQETVASIVEIAQVDPSVLALGSDILFMNMSAPGMDLIAERKRLQLLDAGAIPMEQLTPEEKQAAEEKAQQPPPPDPALILAQAEAKKSEAQTAKVMADAQGKSVELEIQQRKQTLEEAKAQEAARKNQSDLDLRTQAQRFEHMLEQQKLLLEAVASQANSLKVIREAIGADAIMSKAGAVAYEQQAEDLIKAQVPL
jgi:DNA repair exonuclease SbcCD ATPase subunit